MTEIPSKYKAVEFRQPIFQEFLIPDGFLSREPACHALWYYYTLAAKNLEEELHGVVLEGERDPVYNYRQLFMSIATQYGIHPQEMLKYWPNIDMQARVLDLPLLPKGKQYRFEAIPEIKTQ